MQTHSRLAEKAMLVDLDISRWTARKLDRQVTDETNARYHAKADAGRYNKLLIPKSAIHPIDQIAGRANAAHREMTLPWSNSGQRLLAAAVYLKYVKVMGELQDEFNGAVATFKQFFASYVAQRRIELNGMFNEKDYPDPSEIGSRFSFTLDFSPCPDVSDFRIELAQEHEEDLARVIEANTKKKLGEAMKDPVKRIVEEVSHMVERLKAYKPGTRHSPVEGKFHDTLVENPRKLVKLLPAFNLTNDPVLAELINRVERELCAEEPETLRKNEFVRKSVAKSAEDILAEAQAYLG